jgi:hypothetical protein
VSGRLRIGVLVAGLIGFGGAVEAVYAQDDDVGEAVIAIYHVAPGKHVDFLRWQAEAEAVVVEAGGPPTQWYVHLNGDSWDFVSIAPVADDQDAIDDKVQELRRQKGLPTGGAAGVSFRQFIASHTDTEAAGPMTAAQLLAGAQGD